MSNSDLPCFRNHTSCILTERRTSKVHQNLQSDNIRPRERWQVYLELARVGKKNYYQNISFTDRYSETQHLEVVFILSGQIISSPHTEIFFIVVTKCQAQWIIFEVSSLNCFIFFNCFLSFENLTWVLWEKMLIYFVSLLCTTLLFSCMWNIRQSCLQYLIWTQNISSMSIHILLFHEEIHKLSMWLR